MAADLTLWADDAYVSAHAAGAFRPLRLRNPWMHGADVYALQSCLHVHRAEVALDGKYGPQTDDAVEFVQQLFHLVVDRVAGGVTQSTLTTALAKSMGPTYGLPAGVPLGHVQQESSGIPGNYGAEYTEGPAKGTRDRGVVMENSGPFPDTARAFNAVAAIDTIGRAIKAKFEKYRPQVGADKRAWQLACGSWHQPGYTDLLAQGKPLSSNPNVNAELVAHIEDYIDRVTAFAPSLQ